MLVLALPLSAQGASRLVMDNRINAWENTGKNDQDVGRGNGDWGQGFGQTLRGNIRPSDQVSDGPQLPANLQDECVINAHEQPQTAPGGAGFGWTAVCDATEGITEYTRTVSVFEDGAIVETPWLETVVP